MLLARITSVFRIRQYPILARITYLPPRSAQRSLEGQTDGETNTMALIMARINPFEIANVLNAALSSGGKSEASASV